ncbi:MAG: hypothetical protein A2786_00990 [Candidatus Chisholmbacteria bacterium RIFCSPHIGHO2_01_FULL_52_32]|uniref:Uncharacterized protein n=1 Tax=Candidatus Chisholmbacteria bacterium RIFCSPHIGHO2_01_FULL_52_32 TaxID=1797591 RepID=A0A1G1VUB9_9BACT|nr:MAG: hypothetical protein A2786_00990 [Candidatus Chisholmbacteria bacterium RIFCSPHIGHO2_01_FULL_52_32]
MKQLEKTWKLTRGEQAFFRAISRKLACEGKPLVLWGWKRDKVVGRVRYPESRTVYFSADFGLRNDELFIRRAYFFLESRAIRDQISALHDQVGGSRNLGGYPMKVRSFGDLRHPGYRRLRIEIGRSTGYDLRTVARRLLGKPRLKIDPPKLVSESHDYDLRCLTPFAVYCGSGLSAESGLPFLGAIHEVFSVDDPKRGELIFGDRDPLPGKLVRDVGSAFREFGDFTTQAIKARPSDSHRVLADLYRRGAVVQILTDNVDDILMKVGIPYTQTRLSIFPDRFPVTFGSKVRSLLVIGVSVDRREVVKQARRKGLSIVAINPVFGVAPHSRNMDYLQKGDIFFRGKAGEILPKIIAASGF